MKSRDRLTAGVAVAVIAGGLLMLGNSWAQEPPPAVERVIGIEPRDVLIAHPPEVPVMFEKKFNINVNHGGASNEIRGAAEKLRDAEGQDARAVATEELTKLLNQYFEEDMKRRTEELASIMERVKKLHEQMERRAAKRQEIIDLQIKVLENEADGLGFFSEPGMPGHGPAIFHWKDDATPVKTSKRLFFGAEAVPPAPPANRAPAALPAPPQRP